MKSVLFLIILIIFQVCLISSRSSKYGSIITSFIALHEALGKDTNDIEILVSSLATDITDNQDKYDTFHNTIKNQCDGGKLLLSDYIKKIKDDKLALQSSINESQKSINNA